jgi:predicted NBD/HSP70 family sugar kinase
VNQARATNRAAGQQRGAISGPAATSDDGRYAVESDSRKDDGVRMDNESTAWRAQTVRRANLSTVLTAVRTGRRLSRSRLVAETGLTRSAIGGLVAELTELGLVCEDAAKSDGSPGRPSPVARVNDLDIGVLALEIAVDGIGVAVVGLDGAVAHSRRVERARGVVPVDETVREIVALVRALGVESNQFGRRRLVGVGIAIAGLVDDATNVVVRAPNLDWTHVALGEIITRELGLDLPVVVANDGDVGALAEARFGAGMGADDMVFVSGEVGVGGGLFVGGRRVAGRSGFAGELGHMTINPDGQPCRCGATGCWETEVGEPALLSRGGRDPDGAMPAITEMMAAAERGEVAARNAFAAEARWLGIGVSGLINIFDPDVVVLGGFFTRIFPVIEQRLREEIEARSFRGSDRVVAVRAGQLGPDAGLIGAAELAFEPVLNNPLSVG